MRSPVDLWRGELSPLRELSNLQRLMDRMWGDFATAKPSSTGVERAFSPLCEVSEDKGAYFFKFDLPGLTKDQVKIEIHDNQLTVTGERREETKEASKRYHFSEVSYGSFVRSFTLPSNISAERVEARFESGVLSISVAKSEAATPRQINIK